MQNFDAVVFDMDGVIFDSEKLVVECWKQIADKYGIEDIENTCKKCMGITREVTKLLFKEKYGEDFPYDEYKEEMRELFFSQELPLKTGVRELLQSLKNNGKLVALASSTRSEVVTKELAEADLIQYFDELVCGDMVERSKPDPQIYLKACELLKVKPENAYGIEDSYNGIRSVHAAGMRTIMVPDMLPENDEMREKSEIILASLTEVEKYLLG